MPIEQGHGGGTGWSAEQKRNAAIIISVGQEMGMSRRDITIGLMTAMQESSLKNLNYGDRDSLGLFQQRPSQGWGSREQVTDPQYASRKFFSELKKVDGRKRMSLTEAAQAVQRSAYPDAYAKWEHDAQALLKERAGKIQPVNSRSQPTVNPISEVMSTRPTAAPNITTPNLGDYGDQGIVPQINTGIGGSGAMGAPGAPGLAASTAPLTGMPTFGTADDYVNATGGGRFGQKGVNNTRKAIIERAQQVIGTPYKWGGTDLNSGVDCSGFIQSVYKEMGIDLPRVSFQQANYGKRTDLANLKPGDLVAWDNSSRNNGADHIAIFLGNGRVIEAAKPGTSVRIRKLGQDEDAYGVRMNIK